MIGLTVGKQAHRARVFEDIVEATAHTLEDPEIARRLGVLGIDFARLNDEAFLVNVRHRDVRLPREYRESDGIAVVPVSLDEQATGITLSAEMYGPTPQRRRKIDEQARRSPENGVTPEAFIASSQLNIAAHYEFAPFNLSELRPAGVFIGGRSDQDEHDLYFSSRPILFMDLDFPARSPRQVPGITLHEYTHGYDGESADKPFQANDRVYKELRAYHASFVVVDSLDLAELDQTPSAYVEQCRKDHGMKLPPLSPDEHIPDSLVEELQNSGLV